MRPPESHEDAQIAECSNRAESTRQVTTVCSEGRETRASSYDNLVSRRKWTKQKSQAEFEVSRAAS